MVMPHHSRSPYVALKVFQSAACILHYYLAKCAQWWKYVNESSGGNGSEAECLTREVEFEQAWNEQVWHGGGGGGGGREKAFWPFQ